MSRVKKVKVEAFGNEIVQMLNKYNDDIKKGIADASLNVAEEGAKKLQETKQPSGEGGTARPMKRREWKKYSKGWKVKTTLKPAYASAVIHNKTDYQLTHLLEYGHITRNGTRTRAFKHIKPVEEYCQNEFEKKCKEVIKRGGK